MAPPDTIEALGVTLTLDVERSGGEYHRWSGDLMPGVKLQIVRHLTLTWRTHDWEALLLGEYVTPFGFGSDPDEAVTSLCAAIQGALREAHLLGQLVHAMTPARKEVAA